MCATTKPMNKIPVTATRIFFPMVVWKAAGSRSVAVPAAVAVAVMRRSLSSPARLLRRLLGSRFDTALVSVGALEVRGSERELQCEGARCLRRHRLHGADPHARIGWDVAAPLPELLSAGPRQPRRRHCLRDRRTHVA